MNHRRGPSRAGAVAALFTLALSAACGRRPASVATLTEVTGLVEATRGSDETWRGAAPATEFVIDDAVRTGERSSARLSVVAGGTIRLSERSRLRFRRGGAADTAGVELGIDLGRAELENSPALSIATPGGTARIDRGSHVRIIADGTRETLEVVVGRAVLLSSSGGDAGLGRRAPVVVAGGRGVTFRIGAAVMEWFSVQVGEAVLEPAGTAPTKLPTAHASVPNRSSRSGEGGGGAPTVRDESSPAPLAGAKPANEHAAQAEASDARRADVTVTAGDSVVLHDGKSPLLVRLRFADLCPGGGSVEVGPRGRGAAKLSGTAAVVARLGPGVHLYSLRCTANGDGPPRASGVLTVKRDSGNVPLARRAPTNLIEADGRRYTVLFQTRLPVLTLLWAAQGRVPAVGELAVHVESGAGARVFHTRELSLRLPAGTLAEGEHTWWFATADGRESPKTIVAIRFDNTAPTAQFFTPGLADAPPGTVPIDGVTVKGAKVSVAGKPVTVDEHGRFQDAVAPLTGDDAVAVRIEMPHGEAHCYVKRRAQTR